MNIEKQCCSLYFAERLKKLGVLQESLFYHTHSKKWGIMPKQSIDFSGSPTSAFTCAELVQMNLNIHGIHFSEKEKKFYRGDAINGVSIYNSFSDALAEKLINAISMEWVTLEEVNNRLKA